MTSFLWIWIKKNENVFFFLHLSKKCVFFSLRNRFVIRFIYCFKLSVKYAWMYERSYRKFGFLRNNFLSIFEKIIHWNLCTDRTVHWVSNFKSYNARKYWIKNKQSALQTTFWKLEITIRKLCELLKVLIISSCWRVVAVLMLVMMMTKLRKANTFDKEEEEEEKKIAEKIFADGWLCCTCS